MKKILVILFILFFFLVPLPQVKCAMRDTVSCFFKKAKCRSACRGYEKQIGVCTRLNANCCM
ncbi:defensin beta 133 [Phyllostomus discolor]|uniref:Defensin beta 133 n=1 Tax=Phyllostomus discolor TaxID=89673 RepID=A0A834AMI0_9CHIR|nr:defensin beta 133 [Phyllostomus discolor]